MVKDVATADRVVRMETARSVGYSDQYIRAVSVKVISMAFETHHGAWSTANSHGVRVRLIEAKSCLTHSSCSE